VIVGNRYLLRGEYVTVLVQWVTARTDPDTRPLPLVSTARTAPRNVLIRLPDGTVTVRPFRGLRRPGPALLTQLVPHGRAGPSQCAAAPALPSARAG